MSDYIEFINKVKKVNTPRVHKITNSYGVMDAYKYYRKNCPKSKKFNIKAADYCKTVSSINSIIADKLVEGKDIKLPELMGVIEVRKYHIEPYLSDDGKLIYNAPTDWGKTIKLWHSNKEAFEKKLLIKLERDAYFKIKYNKIKAKYRNKTYFTIRACRSLKTRLAKAYKENKLDAFEYTKPIYNDK